MESKWTAWVGNLISFSSVVFLLNIIYIENENSYHPLFKKIQISVLNKFNPSDTSRTTQMASPPENENFARRRTV